MKNLILLSFFVLLTVTSVFGQSVGINTDGSTPDPSALLDVKSSTKGVLFPKLTTTQMNSIVNPASGLLIFNTTTNSLWYRKGTTWTNMALSGGSGITINSTNQIVATDASTTNELQSLAITGGNKLSLAVNNTNPQITFGQGLNVASNIITAVDVSNTNEIQQLSIVGNQLTLNNGGNTVPLPTGTTYTEGTGISIVNNQINSVWTQGNNNSIHTVDPFAFVGIGVASPQSELSIKHDEWDNPPPISESVLKVEYRGNFGSPIAAVQGIATGYGGIGGSFKGIEYGLKAEGTESGILGISGIGAGVRGEGWPGVVGISDWLGVRATGTGNGTGLSATSTGGTAISAGSNSGSGLEANSYSGTGITAQSVIGIAIKSYGTVEIIGGDLNINQVVNVRNSSGYARTELNKNSFDAGTVQTFGSNDFRTFFVSTTSGVNNGGWAGVAKDGTNKAGMYVNASNQGVIWGDTKNFRMPYPDQPGKEIWYASVEGPEAAAYSRGTGTLVNGEAIITFTDDYQIVSNHTTMTVVLTPLDAESKGMAVVEKTATGFKVKELMHGTGNYQFDWEVKCVRKGYEDYRVIRDERESQPVSPAPAETVNANPAIPNSIPGIGKSK